jgi:hypothetical protein
MITRPQLPEFFCEKGQPIELRSGPLQARRHPARKPDSSRLGEFNVRLN